MAREVRRVLGPASGAVVQDINAQLRVTLCGLTALDLSGLTRFIITKILTGVFDPPPHLFVPWAYLATLGGVTCPAVVATVTSVIRARGPAADIMRDL